MTFTRLSRKHSSVTAHSKRLDVQGIRAIAVLSVLIFHFGVALPGGFLGVDMFFVVSGWLIASILIRDIGEGEGRVGIKKFLARRLARLLPGMVLVVTFVLLAQIFFFTDPERRRVSISTGISSILGFSNWTIAYESGGYFGEDAAKNPLLHTWSLAAEWQFYSLLVIIFVFVSLAVATSKQRSTLIRLLAITSLVSFAIGFLNFGSERIDLTGYYSSISRWWEFGVGALLAFVPDRLQLKPAAANLMQLGGLVLLIFSVVFLSPSFDTPGVSTLLPVLGTLLLIAGGKSATGLVHRVVTSRPLVWIGDRSYSVYLWHWPLLVFSYQAGFLSDSGRSWLRLVALVVVVFVVSWISHQLVDMKGRNLGQSHRSRPWQVFSALAIIPLLVATSGHFIGNHYEQFLQSRGLLSGVKPGLIDHDAYLRELDRSFFPCSDESIMETAPEWNGVIECHQSKPNSSPTVVVVGDSHAGHLFSGLALSIPSENVAYYIDGVPVGSSSERMRHVLKRVKEVDSIKVVILSAYWRARGVPEDEITDEIQALLAAGKSVFLINGVPTAHYDPVECKYPKHIFARQLNVCGSERPDSQRILEIHDSLNRTASLSAIKLIDTYSQFCIEVECSIVSQDSDEVLYRDRNHLNHSGSLFVGRVIGYAINQGREMEGG